MIVDNTSLYCHYIGIGHIEVEIMLNLLSFIGIYSLWIKWIKYK